MVPMRHAHCGAIGCSATRCDAMRNGWKLTFFIIPAFRLEKVMCRRDLSWMNLISILRRSRPGLSSSSSSSSGALGRWRLMPRFSPPWTPLPLPMESSWPGEACWSCSVSSDAMVSFVGELSRRVKNYDGLGTVFDRNCLRSSAGFVWGSLLEEGSQAGGESKSFQRATNL